MADDTKATVKVTQIGSPIGRKKDQRADADRSGAEQAAPHAGAGGHPFGPRHDRARFSIWFASRARAENGRGDYKSHETQRDPGQCRRPQEPQARRSRHRFGQGQDLRPRREGSDRAYRRRDQGLRRRPDAAASPPAEARLRQHLPPRTTRSSTWARLQQAIESGKLDAAQPITGEILVAAGVAQNSRDGVRLLGKGA